MLNVKRIINFISTLFLILLVAGITFFMTKMFYFKQNEPKVVANAIYKPVIKDIAIIATLGKNGWTQIKDFYDAGATIFRINGSHIRSKEDMEKMLDIKVNLKLWVKVRNNWRDDEYLLKDLGFSKPE